MRPTINQQFQTFTMFNNYTIDVALLNNVTFLYKAQASILLHYRTPQNQSQLSQLKPFQVSMQNEFQFYLFKSGITNCIFNPVK